MSEQQPGVGGAVNDSERVDPEIRHGAMTRRLAALRERLAETGLSAQDDAELTRLSGELRTMAGEGIGENEATRRLDVVQEQLEKIEEKSPDPDIQKTITVARDPNFMAEKEAGYESQQQRAVLEQVQASIAEGKSLEEALSANVPEARRGAFLRYLATVPGAKEALATQLKDGDKDLDAMLASVRVDTGPRRWYMENSPPAGERSTTANLGREIITTPEGAIYQFRKGITLNRGKDTERKVSRWYLIDPDDNGEFTINRGTDAGTWRFDFDAKDFVKVADAGTLPAAAIVVPGEKTSRQRFLGKPITAADSWKIGRTRGRRWLVENNAKDQWVFPDQVSAQSFFNARGATAASTASATQQPGAPTAPAAPTNQTRQPTQPTAPGAPHHPGTAPVDVVAARLRALDEAQARGIPQLRSMIESLRNAGQPVPPRLEALLAAYDGTGSTGQSGAAPRTGRLRRRPNNAPPGARTPREYLTGEQLDAKVEEVWNYVIDNLDDDEKVKARVRWLLARVSPTDRADVVAQMKDDYLDHLDKGDDEDAAYDVEDPREESDRFSSLVDKALSEVETREQTREQNGNQTHERRPGYMSPEYMGQLNEEYTRLAALGEDVRYGEITQAQRDAARGNAAAEAALAARERAQATRTERMTEIKKIQMALGIQRENVNAQVAGSPAAGQIDRAHAGVKRSIAAILAGEAKEYRDKHGKVWGTLQYLWRWHAKAIGTGMAAGALTRGALLAGAAATGGVVAAPALALLALSGVPGALVGAMRGKMDSDTAKKILAKDIQEARATGNTARVAELEGELYALNGTDTFKHAVFTTAMGAGGGMLGGWLASLWYGGGGGAAAAVAPAPGAGTARAAASAVPPPVGSRVPGTIVQNGPFRSPTVIRTPGGGGFVFNNGPRRIGVPPWYTGRGAPPPMVIGKAQIDTMASGVLFDRFGRPSVCGMDHHARGLLIQNRGMVQGLPKLKIMTEDTNWVGGKRCIERLLGAPPRVGETFIAEGMSQGRGVVRAPDGSLVQFRTPRFTAGINETLQPMSQTAPRVVPFEAVPPSTRGGGGLVESMPNGVRTPRGGFASNLFAESAQVRRGGSITVGEGFLGSTAGSTGIDGYVDKTLFGERGVLSPLSPKSKEVFTDVVRQALRQDEGLLRNFFGNPSGNVSRFYNGTDIKFIDGTKMNPAALGRSSVVDQILQRIGKLPDSEPAFSALKNELTALANQSGGWRSLADEIGNALALKRIPGENVVPAPVTPRPPTSFGGPQQVA